MLHAFIEVAGDVDVRTRLAIAQQAEALLLWSWTEDEVTVAARTFAKLPADPRRFAMWAHSQRLARARM